MRQRRLVDARMILCASPVYHPYRPEWHHWWSMLKSESGGGNELIWFWFNWVWLFINEKKHWYYVCPCDLWWIHTLHFICLEKLWTAFLFRCYLFCMLEGFPMFQKVIFFFIYSKPQWLHWKMVALGRWVKGSCLLFFKYYKWGGGDGGVSPHLIFVTNSTKREPGTLSISMNFEWKGTFT